MTKHFNSKTLKKNLLALLAFAIAALFAGPFIYIILTSLKGPEEIFMKPVQLFPHQGWNWQSYIDIWSKSNFGAYFKNSVMISSLTTLVSVIIAILAGLGFARYKLPNWLLLTILLSQLFPLVLLVSPFYVLMQDLEILDTHRALIISYTSFALPYSVWMLTGYFRSIPIDLEEAAMIDGTSRFGAFLRVTIPLAGPGIAATVIYCFILCWNEFLFATTFITTPEMRTLPVGLQSFIGMYKVEWNMLMTGAVVTTLPVVALFIFLQRYLVAGLTAGAVKG